ncbi:MAG: hypothetical protein E7199_00815 [Schwartzia succinivorans]|nr:hypothetical protein [Schwartzia succinivorans]
MGVTIAANPVITFIPKGVETVKANQVCVTFIPKGVLRIWMQGMLLTFVPESNEKTSTAETVRNIAVSAQTSMRAARTLVKTERITAAAVRFVLDMSAPITVEALTVRDVFMTRQAAAATIREIYAVRSAVATAVIQTAIDGEASVSFAREIYQTARIPADTARHIPYILRPSPDNPLAPYTAAGIQSISVTLSERTLSDTFQMTTVKPMNIEDSVKGSLLDYSYSFLVEETSQQHLVQTVKGMYGVDALLYTPFCFPPVKWEPIDLPEDDPAAIAAILTAGGECSRYVARIAEVLGLKLSVSYEDYQMAQDYSDSGMTYRDLVSALFGWTARLPQRQINVFIRGDTLHVIQRGMEKSVLDITEWPHTRPQIDRKMLRSLWNKSTDDDYDPRRSAQSDREDSQVPFSGVIGVGKVHLRYAGGYLVYETNNGDETEYRYDGEYLVSKFCRRTDGTTIKTDYEYHRTAKDVYLMLETEVTHTEKKKTTGTANDYETITEVVEENKTTTRTTYHAPIGGGWYLTSVYVDKKFQGSSLSQGPPGGKASQYMVDAMNRHLSNSLGTPFEPVPLKGTSLIDTSFPVRGYEFLRELTKAIEWLNRKTQEDVSLEIVANVKNGVPDITHVVDFTERVKLDGKEYFLVSNNVELTPRSLKQKLRLVRWY